MNTSIYASRLALLNNIENKTVWDCIDRPIRPLVYELNRIGLKTHFSCCGFQYDNEEEPKSHGRAAFVVFETGTEHSQRIFFTVASIVMANRWSLMPYYSINRWHIHYDDTKEQEVMYGKDGIHNYEGKLLAICRLTEALSKLPTVTGNIVIDDGNANPSYNMLGGEWQVKPKPSVILTEEIKNK